MDIRRSLHAVARKILISNEDAEDAVQELFVRTWKNGRTDASIEQRRAFLHTALRNICIDILRRRKPMVEFEPSEPSDSSDRVENRDTVEAIRMAARRRLSGTTLQVFELYSFHELDYDEIASQLNIRVDVARSYMCRARKALRDECQRLINGQ